MNWWEQAVAWCKDFFNQPVPIIGVSVGLLILYTLVIFSKTSIGKKILRKLTDGYNSLKSEFTSFKDETSKKLEEQKEFYENEIKNIEAKTHEMQSFVLWVAENSTNEKIKEKAETLKKDLTSNVVAYEKELNEEIDSYKDSLKKEYESELKAYKEEFDKIISEYKNLALSVQNNANSVKEEVESVKEIVEESIEEVKEDVREQE